MPDEQTSFVTSIIIPCKNEENNIVPTLAGILKHFGQAEIDVEIIVVLDGSTDNSEHTVRAYGDTHRNVHVVRNEPPLGFGNAIKKGLEHFTGDCVILAMADACDDPADMVEYTRKIQEGYDCCFGTRWTKKARVQGYPRYKYFLNRIANTGIRLLFGLSYNDTTNAFKCYSRQAIRGITPVLSRHFNATVELPLKAIVRGYSYTVIPTNWRGRIHGTSSLRLQEMGSRYLFIIIYIFLEKLLCGTDYKK